MHELDRVGDKPERRDIDLGNLVEVGLGANRAIDHGPVAFFVMQPDFHRDQRQQDVGEDYRRIHLEPLDCRDRDFGRELGPLAQIKKIVLLANAPVLRHVAPCLAHQPNRSVGRGLAPARLHHRMIGKRRTRRVGNRRALRNWRRDRFNPIGARALGDKNRSCLRRCLFDEVAELRMLGLEVHTQPVRANLLRANRPDRAHRHPRESAVNGVADSLGLGELDYVRHLVRAGENCYVRSARRNRVQRRAQRCAIGGQRPPVNRNNRDARAARLEPGGQLVI